MKKIFLICLLIISYILSYSQTSNGLDYNTEGIQYYNENNIEAAVACFKKSASLGNAYGQYNLGICYFRALGVPYDETKAAQWMLKAANQGFAWAQYKMGFFCHRKNNDTKSLEWYQMAASQGNVLAEFKVGEYYDLIDENPSKAMNWYRKAALHGSVWAQIAMGDHYADGDYVTKNLQTAEYWYKKAMNQGDMSPFDRFGIIPDYSDVDDWWSAEGNSTAKRRLRDLYNQ